MNGDFIEEKCKWCNSSNLKFILTPQSVHHGKLECIDCKRLHKWIKKPDNENQRTKTSRYDLHDLIKFYDVKKPFCFLCLRQREQLGAMETLTIDHIQELSKGGIDELNNLQILCSACHKIKNWLRLYLNWHLNNKEVYNGNTKTTSE